MLGSIDETRAAIDASGAEMVTVALRRVDLTPGKPSVLDAIDKARHVLLPNTAGCYTVEDAVRSLCKAFKEGKIPNSMNDDTYSNVRTVKKKGMAA